MNLFIIFSIVLSTIILAIVLERIINCPILVGFAFFAIYLIVAAVLDDTTLIIFAIVLGIIAFLSAFIYCLFINSDFLCNNSCLSCSNNNSNDSDNTSCNNNVSDLTDTLTIVNSNGEIVARINGSSINYTTGYGNENVLLSGNNSSYCSNYNRKQW